jgi:hypothetical protein
MHSSQHSLDVAVQAISKNPNDALYCLNPGDTDIPLATPAQILATPTQILATPIPAIPAILTNL